MQGEGEACVGCSALGNGRIRLRKLSARRAVHTRVDYITSRPRVFLQRLSPPMLPIALCRRDACRSYSRFRTREHSTAIPLTPAPRYKIAARAPRCFRFYLRATLDACSPLGY